MSFVPQRDRLWFFAPFIAVSIVSSMALAQTSVPIANASFESSTLSDGNSTTTITGWTASNAKVVNYTSSDFTNATDTSSTQGALPGTATGRNAVYIASNTSTSGSIVNGYIYQDIGTLLPNTNYTLTASFGQALTTDSAPTSSATNGYADGFLEAVNGTSYVGTPLKIGTDYHGPAGSFSDDAISFTTGNNVSGDLTIVAGIDGSEYTSTTIDNIRLTQANSTAAPTATPASISIMPLGDSITKGARDGDGGYRSRLYADLIDAGQPTTFVGAATTCASTILNGVGQGDHNGYGSYKISDLYQNLAGTTSSANPEGGDNNDGGYWMTGGGGTGRSAVYPSVVTLMAGTNDADSGESAATMETYMSQLLNWFAANRPSTLMMVGSVIPSSSSSPEANIETFNTWLQTVEIPSLDKNNPKEFVFVDLHSPFIDSNGNLKTSTSPDGIYLYDGIHPSHAGYTAMGDAFDNAIVADMPEPGALPAFCMVCAAVLLKRRRMPVGLGLRENGVSVRVHERRSAEKAICAI